MLQFLSLVGSSAENDRSCVAALHMVTPTALPHAAPKWWSQVSKIGLPFVPYLNHHRAGTSLSKGSIMPGSSFVFCPGAPPQWSALQSVW
eukprot:1500927-Ditylum_brightwellii.AAC.1